jgi:selenocysteine-specific translation elongation factor
LGYGGNLGKKGTATDITFYNLKKGEDTVTIIEPSRYPERLAPLYYAVSLSKYAVVVIDEINAGLGEMLVMLQCANISQGVFVLRNYISKEKIEPLLKGTNLAAYEFMQDDQNSLREKLLALAAQQKHTENATHPIGMVPVDPAFNVKGVGVVILGVVSEGTIAKHASMKVLPGTKTAQIRSIQKHDDEFDLAGEGDRVGLALKNVEVEDVDRGAVLTNDPAVKAESKLKVKATLVKYWQMQLKAGMVMHVGNWAQFVTCKVDEATDEGDWRKPTLTLSFDKPLVYKPCTKAVLMYLEGTKLRVAGTIDLP